MIEGKYHLFTRVVIALVLISFTAMIMSVVTVQAVSISNTALTDTIEVKKDTSVSVPNTGTRWIIHIRIDKGKNRE